VEHVLSHQACVPGIEKPVSVEEACDAGRMAELLAAQPALGEPASRFYYHALTFGWLCGELVRRVDGRTIGQFFKAEIATPLRLDAWIGLPESEEPRVAYLETDAPIVGAADERPAYDRIGWSIWENPPRFSEHALAANTRIWRAAEVPGSNGVATARSLARLYGDLVGDRHAGLLSPELLADATRCRVEAVDPYLDEPLAFGLGFALQSTLKPFGPAEHAFGHAGVGGSIHGAWPREQVGFSYITSSLSTSDGVDGVERGAALLDALHRSIVKRTN